MASRKGPIELASNGDEQAGEGVGTIYRRLKRVAGGQSTLGQVVGGFVRTTVNQILPSPGSEPWMESSWPREQTADRTNFLFRKSRSVRLSVCRKSISKIWPLRRLTCAVFPSSTASVVR